MSTSARFGLRLGLLAAVVLASGGWARQHEGHGDAGPAAGTKTKVLTVCAVPSAMPRTGRTPDGTPQGLDIAVVKLVGRDLGRPIEFHWCASAECGWNCLPEGRCDVVVGQPHDSGPPRDVAWSVPYAGARFGLVVPRDSRGIGSLADLQGKRVGVVAGVLTTAGGLVFAGDAEGFFTAYDAQSGKILWNFQCGSGHHSGPMTYRIEGRQYVAVCVGWGGWTAGFAGDGAPWLRNARRGNTLFVFALPEGNQ